MQSENAASSIPVDQADFALRMLKQMSFIRAFEAKVQALTQSNPPLISGSVHLCAGQEAVPAAAIAGAQEDDQVLATYRGHGWAIASGIDPQLLMDEICHRRTGLNGGRAGSAYLQAPHTRFIGENSIVGAAVPIACGIALSNLHARNNRIVMVSIGDGAMNQGAVHEGFVLAAAKKLPILFICENNGWSELTPTSDMFTINRLAQRGGGYGIKAATMSGTDPFAVRDAVAIALQQCREDRGPNLLEFRVPRLWGHYNRDIEHYRSKADKDLAVAQDPITLLTTRLVSSGAATPERVRQVIADQEAMVEQLADRALAAPPPDYQSACMHVVAAAPANADAPQPSAVEVREMTYIEAVNAALRTELATDPNALVFGEDVGKAGGIFGASRYLQRDFGPDRVFDMPIAESAILGSAVGAAIGGMKPIAEIMWSDFVFVALDQLVNQAANVRYVTQGCWSLPMVVRMQQGMTPGSCSQHSQSIEAIIAHIPGLKVAMPATPQDAFSILRAAAADPDPCVVIESRALYQTRGPVALTEIAEAIGRARFHRRGTAAVIVTWGTMLQVANEAALLLEQDGIEVSVLDLRWLSPLDEASLIAAVRQANGNVVIVHEAVRTGGFGAEVAMRLSELLGEELDLRVRRVTSPDVRIPASPALQVALLPNAEKVALAVRQLLPTHT